MPLRNLFKWRKGAKMMRIDHRILTSWVQDVSRKPAMGRRWPITDFDLSLLEDYCLLIDFAREYGYTGIVAWGLFVGHDWPVELDNCLTGEKHALLKQLFEYADKRGITLYVGLGVYSWGFEKIIRENPVLSQGEYVKSWGQMTKNRGDVMCYHQPEARVWMRKIIDYIVDTVDAPAFQLQPFDKGRCMCVKCRMMSDAEYFSALMYETADYIKSRWPSKTVGVSGWGMHYNSFDDIHHVRRMAEKVDYISDVTNSCRDMGQAFRQKFIREIPCAFGDSAGGSVTPPQTWEKLRWFFPHIGYNADSIRSSAADGARVIEVFAAPLKNPSSRFSLAALGEILIDPNITNFAAAQNAAKAIYDVSDEDAKAIAQVMLETEESYFTSISPDHKGDVLFERLDAVFPSCPIYLTKASKEGLLTYRDSLLRAYEKMNEIKNGYRQNACGESIFDDTLNAILNAVNEVEYTLLGAWEAEGKQ